MADKLGAFLAYVIIAVLAGLFITISAAISFWAVTWALGWR